MRLTKEASQQVFTAEVKACGNIGKDARQCADAEGRVAWNRDVVLAALLCGQAKVTAGLARNAIAQCPSV